MEKIKRIAYLDYARVLAMICITMTHAVNRSFDNYNTAVGQAMILSPSESLFRIIVSIVSRIGVPLFLMITGALVLSKSFEDKAAIRKFYKNNLLPIFITSEIWYFVMYWFIQLNSAGQAVHSMSREDVGLLMLGCLKNQEFVDQVTMDCMWYISMILCVYLVIPIAAICKDRIPYEAVLLPCLVLLFSDMIIPSINNLLVLQGSEKTISFALYGRNVYSMYFLYIIAGYLISKGVLSRFSTGLLGLLLAASFTAVCFYQDYVWSLPEGYLVDYNFPGFLLIALLVFELLRRSGKERTPSKTVTYISKISFGIFFTHILIMDTAVYFIGDAFSNRIEKALLLETISLAVSVLFIWLVSRSQKLSRILFVLK